MKYASKSIINYIWYVGYEIEDDKAVIQLHDRLRFDEDGPDTNNDQYELIEDDNRVVLKLIIKDYHGHVNTYSVANPDYVFSYPKF
jgi:hypothetical protein